MSNHFFAKSRDFCRNDSEEELAIFESILSQRPDIAEMLAYKARDWSAEPLNWGLGDIGFLKMGDPETIIQLQWWIEKKHISKIQLFQLFQLFHWFLQGFMVSSMVFPPEILVRSQQENEEQRLEQDIQSFEAWVNWTTLVFFFEN